MMHLSLEGNVPTCLANFGVSSTQWERDIQNSLRAAKGDAAEAVRKNHVKPLRSLLHLAVQPRSSRSLMHLVFSPLRSKACRHDSCRAVLCHVMSLAAMCSPCLGCLLFGSPRGISLQPRWTKRRTRSSATLRRRCSRP